MKTGRLLKFERRDGTVHAYFFREAGLCHATIYLLGGPSTGEVPVHELSGPDEADIETRARVWLDQHYPRR